MTLNRFFVLSAILLLGILVVGCAQRSPIQSTADSSEEAMAPSAETKPSPVPKLEDGPPLIWDYAAITLASGTIEYATLLPPDFDPARSYPLLLALPPGGQDKSMVDAGMETFWQRGALYGFVIVSPVKPDGTNYMSDGSLVLPEFVAFLQETYNIAGEKPHLGGVSNGGISTFKAALERPDLYLSLTVLPGFADPYADLSPLRDLRISLYVGETDGRWVVSSQLTYDALLRTGHTDSQLEILTGEGHLIQTLAGDGASLIFERLLAE